MEQFDRIILNALRLYGSIDLLREKDVFYSYLSDIAEGSFMHEIRTISRLSSEVLTELCDAAYRDRASMNIAVSRLRLYLTEEELMNESFAGYISDSLFSALMDYKGAPGEHRAAHSAAKNASSVSGRKTAQRSPIPAPPKTFAGGCRTTGSQPSGSSFPDDPVILKERAEFIRNTDDWTVSNSAKLLGIGIRSGNEIAGISLDDYLKLKTFINRCRNLSCQVSSMKTKTNHSITTRIGLLGELRTIPLSVLIFPALELGKDLVTADDLYSWDTNCLVDLYNRTIRRCYLQKELNTMLSKARDRVVKAAALCGVELDRTDKLFLMTTDELTKTANTFNQLG